jgi:hypothetical protein
MRMTALNGFYGFPVVDLSTGYEIPVVMWVDDTTLEYATLRFPLMTANGDIFTEDIHKVTAVRVDYVNKRIEVNTPPAQTAPWPFPTSQGKQCDACCQPQTCQRIDFCAAYRCRFGQDSKP